MDDTNRTVESTITNIEAATPSTGREVAQHESTRSRRGYSQDGIINAWLDSVKSRRSGSARTQTEYKTILLQFKELLEANHLKLIPSEEEETYDYIAALADAAQIFAKRRFIKSQYDDVDSVSANTQKLRTSVLSSFYAYAIKRRHMQLQNPIILVDRPTTKDYAGAVAIEEEEVAAALAEIIKKIGELDPVKGRREIAGLRRNLAILVVLLSTGRRANEVLSLRRKHVKVNKNKTIRLHFEIAKGGKQFKDVLSPEASTILASWLNYWYDGAFFRQPEDAPLWVDITHTARGKNKPLEYPGLRYIINKHLGTTKVHVTRHTFAVLMSQLGAQLTDIQRLLGHENAATTGGYLEALKDGDENALSGELAQALGIRKKKQQ